MTISQEDRPKILSIIREKAKVFFLGAKSLKPESHDIITSFHALRGLVAKDENKDAMLLYRALDLSIILSNDNIDDTNERNKLIVAAACFAAPLHDPNDISTLLKDGIIDDKDNIAGEAYQLFRKYEAITNFDRVEQKTKDPELIDFVAAVAVQQMTEMAEFEPTYGLKYTNDQKAHMEAAKKFSQAHYAHISKDIQQKFDEALKLDNPGHRPQKPKI